MGCGYHGMRLEDCPCPKGDGAWLEYRRLWVEQRRLVAELRTTNDLLGREAARHETENRLLRAEIEPMAASSPNLVDLVGADQEQIVILALAELQLRRPGWSYAIEEIVSKLGGSRALEMVIAFRETSSGHLKSFTALRDEIYDWCNGTLLGGPVYPHTTEAGKAVREIVDRLAEIILRMEEQISGR